MKSIFSNHTQKGIRYLVSTTKRTSSSPKQARIFVNIWKVSANAQLCSGSWDLQHPCCRIIAFFNWRSSLNYLLQNNELHKNLFWGYLHAIVQIRLKRFLSHHVGTALHQNLQNFRKVNIEKMRLFHLELVHYRYLKILHQELWLCTKRSSVYSLSTTFQKQQLQTVQIIVQLEHLITG